MPKFSAFTRFGHLTFSGNPAHGRSIHNALTGMLGGDGNNYSLAGGTHEAAKLYARSMHYARQRYALERAANNFDPLKSTEMLAVLEKDFELTPSLSDTLVTRRATLAAQRVAPGGARLGNLLAAISLLLGPDFVALRLVKLGEAHTYPANPATGPGIYPRDLSQPSRTFFLTGPISITGASLPFGYQRPGVDDGVRLRPGDVASVQVENNVLAEKVTILGVSAPGAPLTAIASFTKAHDGPSPTHLGASIIAGPVPVGMSSQRTVYIIGSASAVNNPVTRSKVNALMRKMFPIVTQWFFVAQSGPGAVGAFAVESTPLVTSTLATLGYP